MFTKMYSIIIIPYEAGALNKPLHCGLNRKKLSKNLQKIFVVKLKGSTPPALMGK